MTDYLSQRPDFFNLRLRLRPPKFHNQTDIITFTHTYYRHIICTRIACGRNKIEKGVYGLLLTVLCTTCIGIFPYEIQMCFLTAKAKFALIK